VSLVPFEDPEDFMTCIPKNPSLASVKRKIIKDSRSTIKRQIDRYFVIDNFLITFYKGEFDANFHKNCSLDGAYV
jgi:hypothetical protein